jgi:GMP synthase (glutamine-hydrolysing)
MSARSRDRIKILLFQLRTDDEEKKLEIDSFARAAKLASEQLVSFDVLQRVPDAAILSGAQAVFIGGSKFSVFEDVPNQAALIETIKAAREKKLPILGICYGAQLLAHAYGGQVVRDKEHEERGTFTIQGSDDALFDMLFSDAPDSFPAQCSHHDTIVKLPPGATLLATSAHCPTQAFSIPGADIYGLQFHSERSKADFERLIAKKKNESPASIPALDQIRLEESPAAEELIVKFIDRIVLQR